MRRRGGFTIVDVLLTVIIIGILASVMMPKLQAAQVEARRSARAALLDIYNKAVQRFQTDTDLYPAKLSHLAQTTPPANGLSVNGSLTPLNSRLFQGPYVSGIEPDPVLNKPFVYIKTGKDIGTVVAPDDPLAVGAPET